MSGNREIAARVTEVVATPPREETQLIGRARGGDAAAFSELVRRHQDIAFRTALVFAGSAAEAEEATQEALVKAWRGLGRFRDSEPLRPWLLAIVANEARSRRRAEQRRIGWARRAQAEWPTAAVEPDPALARLDAERREQLLAAIATLPPRHREVLVLRFLLDMNEREMAAALGCRPGTVKSRLSRALDGLREAVTA